MLIINGNVQLILIYVINNIQQWWLIDNRDILPYIIIKCYHIFVP